MNIFHKVALQSLRGSRTRTLVTILGVALSTALITAVSAFVVSLQNYMIEGAEVRYGDWHIGFTGADSFFEGEQSRGGAAEYVVSFANIGYAVLEGSENPDKPYLFIAGLGKEAFKSLPIHLIAGRLPENGNELVVSAHIEANSGVKINPGDTVTLQVGIRRAGEGMLSQHDIYRAGEETFVTAGERSYTVVGICQKPAFEEYAAPGYTALTLEEAEDGAETRSVFVRLKNPYRLQSYIKSTGRSDYELNDNVLRFLGLSDDTIFNTLLFSAGGILIVLVMLGSVFLIYNAFHISLNERMYQFGILMSVGATEKQLRNSVLFEGVCIGAMGIPPGMMIGILGIRLVLPRVSENFANVMYDSVPLEPKISVAVLAAAAAISMITILLSAYIPARGAAGSSVMECIRQTKEIRIEENDMRISVAARRLYGLEEVLALKNFRRNKRRYRSIVLSLTLSVVLFLSTDAFRTGLRQVVERAAVLTTYDIALSTPDMEDDDMLALSERLRAATDVSECICQEVAVYTCTFGAKELSESMREELGLRNQEAEFPVQIQFLDDKSWLYMIDSLGLSREKYNVQDGRLLACAKEEFAGASMKLTVSFGRDGASEGTERDILIDFIDFVPPDIPFAPESSEKEAYMLRVEAPWSLRERLVPDDSDIRVKGMTFCSDDPGRSTARIQEELDGMGLNGGYMLLNVYKMSDDSRNILFVINLLTSIFIAMLSLIAVANVFNTISTNIRLRRRELAMLRSVGMSDRDFDRMMCFECICYGLRTLMVGLPVSGVFSWLIHRGFIAGGAENINFLFPWGSMGISVMGVFFVIFISMLYAVRRIRRENIIDALRDDVI